MTGLILAQTYLFKKNFRLYFKHPCFHGNYRNFTFNWFNLTNVTFFKYTFFCAKFELCTSN